MGYELSGGGIVRLWHYKLIPYLPKSQLLAQWREINTIFAGKDQDHILIRYAKKSNTPLYYYSVEVAREMSNRGYKVNAKRFDEYFENVIYSDIYEMFPEHNNEYLTICYWNLREKYLRGQKDFTKEVWDKLDYFVRKELEQ